jgi:hypothetical protein
MRGLSTINDLVAATCCPVVRCCCSRWVWKQVGARKEVGLLRGGRQLGGSKGGERHCWTSLAGPAGLGGAGDLVWRGC